MAMLTMKNFPSKLRQRFVQSLRQQCVAFALAVVGNRRVQRRFFADEDNLFFGAGNGGVKKISLQHDAVGADQRQNHDGVFAALAFVNADGVCQRQFRQFVFS